MRIDDQVVDHIKSRARIEEIASDYVDLKPKGNRLWACCPFHAEKTPSFSIIPSMGIYKCFGCGQGGDAISFLQEINKMSYTEALLHLADRYHIEISYSGSSTLQSEEQQTKEGLYALMSFAVTHYIDRLHQQIEGQSIALRYFEERKLDASTINSFSLGYAPKSGKDLLKTASQRGLTIEQLKVAGLLHQSGQRDLFVGRVLFPIHNLSGKVIAFGARSIGNAEPKYLNSPETPLYHKNQVLYGLYQARAAIRSTKHAYIVEGYMDLLTMVQYGYTDVVAPAGTSLTEAQARLLKQFASSVTILFDGDNAGQRATLRSIDTLLSVGLDVFTITLPDEMDPDSYLHSKGKDGFDTYIASERRSFLSFKSAALEEQLGHTPQAKAEGIGEILRSIQLVPDELAQRMLIEASSKELNIPEELLYRRFAQLRASLSSKSETRSSSPNEPTIQLSQQSLKHQEREILKMLLIYGPSFDFLGHYVLTEIEDLNFSHMPYAELRRALDEAQSTDRIIDYSSIFSHSDDKIKATAHELLPRSTPSKLPLEQEVQSLAQQSIIRLKRAYIGQKIQENVRSLEEISSTASSSEEEQLLMDHKKLKHLYKHLSQLLESVIFVKNTL